MSKDLRGAISVGTPNPQDDRQAAAREGDRHRFHGYRPVATRPGRFDIGRKRDRAAVPSCAQFEFNRDQRYRYLSRFDTRLMPESAVA